MAVAYGTEVPGEEPSGSVAAGPDGDPDPVRRRRFDMSRRGFLRTGSIGVVAAGVAGSVPGLSSILTTAGSDAPAIQGGAADVQGGAAVAEGEASGVAQAFSARVSDLSTGEMRIFVGNQTLEVRDADLAQRLSQAARAAQAAGQVRG